MKYTDFVKAKMQDPEIKALPPKQRMSAIGKMWKASKTSGTGAAVAAQTGGGKSKSKTRTVKKDVVAMQMGGSATSKTKMRKRKRRQMAEVYDGEADMDVEQEGGSLALGAVAAVGAAGAWKVANALAGSNKIPPTESVAAMQGGSAWGDFKYGFSLPFRAASFVSPIVGALI